MCGIYGSTKIYDDDQVKSKLQRSFFRGPDKMGTETYNYAGNSVIFGHNRLAIIDLDSRSNQPFTYNGNIHIVYNGEVYNYMEIKKILISKGYHFKTTSDTEVVCAAYLEYGDDCVDHFNGMFSFVIYDENKQILFGARDRLGKKPFYYFHNGKEFEFSSQISSIQLYRKNISISESSITDYFVWGYIPDPNSIFNEIKKLPAGHSFIFNINSGLFTEKKYWDIDYTAKHSFIGNYEDAKVELEKLLYDAVKIRLFADVPVGVFLSGGVDSSLIAAMASKSTNEKVKTFSVKFNNKGFDESSYAQLVAHHLKTDHHTIECNYDEGIDLIENLCYFYDEPFADSSAIPSMLLSKYTRRQVTVALSGDGGDEAFLGYHRYNWINIAKRYYQMPTIIKPAILNTLNAIPYYKSKVIAGVLEKKSLNDAYISMITSAGSKWLKNKTPDITKGYNKYLFHKNKNIYERISDFDLKTYLNGDINTKVDRATMAYSLEARAPLLDYRIIEFSRSIPTSFKFQNKNQKRILKDILYNHVPKEIFDRPKAGFTMPFKDWFRNELKEFVLSELSESELKDIPGINVEVVSKMIKQHMDGSWNNYALIWTLLVLKQWLDKNGKGISII